MATRQKLWMVVALVGAALTWNVFTAHVFSARAQEAQQFPFSTGDTISMGFIPDGVVTCVVGEIRGNFLRCAPGKEKVGFSQPAKEETWYNLATVKYIDKALARR